jgi:ATP-dependent DNA helicase RecG
MGASMPTSRLTIENTAVLGSAAPDRVARVIAAFLNTSGGRLLLGVDDEGHVVGIEQGLTGAWFRRKVEDQISPPPRFSIITRHVAGKEIALIDVPSGSERPYVVDDVIYAWRGADATPASAREISQMIVTQSDEAPRWEREPALGFTPADLDERQLLKTRDAYRERGIRPKREARDQMSFLEELNVAKPGQILNSAVVLFATADHSLPQCRVKLAAFRGSDMSDFLENRLLEGNIFDLFDQIIAFFERRVPSPSHFEALERHDTTAIPPFVLREAVMNALVHRDYAQASANTMIALHPDRLEVWNPGQLPEGVSPEALPRTHVSRPHNPDIAYVAYLRGLVEQWGSGTGRIVAECRRAGLKDPEWMYVSNGVLLRVFTAHEASHAHALNERMRRFLANSYPGQGISVEDYQAFWAKDASERTARRDLDELVDLGYLFVRDTRPVTFIRSDKVDAQY